MQNPISAHAPFWWKSSEFCAS